MTSTSFPVKETLIYDTLPLAAMIESHMAHYLRPREPGLYLEGKDKPVFPPHRRYFCVEDGQMREIQIKRAADVKTDIYNDSDQLVFSAKAIKRLRDTADLPIVGMQIVEAQITSTIEQLSAWTLTKGEQGDEYWWPFITPEYHHTPAVFEKLRKMLGAVRKEVASFIGEDEWIMHFTRNIRGGIMIEKTIDYRIFAWEQEHGKAFRQRRG